MTEYADRTFETVIDRGLMSTRLQWRLRPAEATGPGADRHAEVAYEQIAPVYDDFTAHHDYRAWIDALLKLGAAHGLRGDTVARRRPAAPARASCRCSTAAGR